MADPISIIGAVGAIASIIDVVGKSIKCINDLRDHWKEADLTFLSLVSQLTALRMALVKIQEWVDNCQDDPHHQLVMDLSNSISYCQLLVTKLDVLICQLSETSKGPLELSSKVKLVFGSRDVEYVQKLIERQTGVLTLLLTACGKTMPEQKVLLEKPKTRKTFAQAKTDSESLWVLRDTDSLRSRFTDHLSKLSVTFDFDNTLFSSKVYARILRGSIKEVLRRQPLSKPESQSDAGPPLGERKKDPYELEMTNGPTKRWSQVLFFGVDEKEQRKIFRRIRDEWNSETHNREEIPVSYVENESSENPDVLIIRGVDHNLQLFNVKSAYPGAELTKMKPFYDIRAISFVLNLHKNAELNLTALEYGADDLWDMKLDITNDLQHLPSVIGSGYHIPIILFISGIPRHHQRIKVAPYPSVGHDIINIDEVNDYVFDCFRRVISPRISLHAYFSNSSSLSKTQFLLDILNNVETKSERAFQKQLENETKPEEYTTSTLEPWTW